MKLEKLLPVVVSLLVLAGCGKSKQPGCSFSSGSLANVTRESTVSTTGNAYVENYGSFSQEVKSTSTVPKSSEKRVGNSSFTSSQTTSGTLHTTLAPTKPASTSHSEVKTTTITTARVTPATSVESTISGFDADKILRYAQNYGTSIGLTLDGSAVSSWDDPVMVNASCVNLERDIRDRLDWYQASGYTAFWVWTADLGGGNYQIYIGYA